MKKKEKTKSNIWKDFRQFIARGNILDLAIGVIVGGAFGKIVTSLVNDILMPLVALALGKTSMNGLCLVLNGVPKYVTDQTTGAQILNPEAILWNYGNFLQTVLDFLIIALVVFLFVRTWVRMKRRGEAMMDRLEDRIQDYRDRKNAASTESDPAVTDLAAAAETTAAASETQDAAHSDPEPVPAETATPAATPASNSSEKLLEEIRDLLKQNLDLQNKG